MEVIINKAKFDRLVGAVEQLQTLNADGTLAAAFAFNAEGDNVHKAVTAFDNLATATAVIRVETRNASPFLRYRREIIADTPSGAALRRLVLSLYGRHAAPLRDLFEHFGEHESRVALECITSFATHGDRDSQFMGLGLEIGQAISDEPIEVVA
ncbi:hypothetical protein [Azonexus sp. R2A61]|uniref:hypothetical protein n=1 Tax=Azonexus sp. R2A61 TaxID=2744443 RepID=UPI001F3C0268|nr:hypothetical protein [Azonexus sp. R2A61]